MLAMSIHFVYILTNPAHTMLCVGVTSDLVGRIRQYDGRRRVAHAFPGRFRCHQLVYYEEYHRAEDAARRGLELRSWKRIKKERLVRRLNPMWRPLNGHFDMRLPRCAWPELSATPLPI
jgi:putative endonuclease